MISQIEHIKEIIPTLYDIEKNSIKKIEKTRELFMCRRSVHEYILRISNYKSIEWQQQEVKWLQYLHNNGIKVAYAIVSKNGKEVEEIVLDKKTYAVVIFKKAKGAKPTSDQWNEHLFENCGQIIGKMHNVSEMNNSDTDKIIIDDWYNCYEYDFEKYIPSSQNKLIEQYQTLYSKINKLEKNNQTYGVIHSDFCEGNIFVFNNEITLFDFQDFEQHYFINDLAIFIYFGVFCSYNGVDLNRYSINLVTSLFKGYQKERNLDPYWINTIPLFLKLREMLSLIMMYCYYDLNTLDDDTKILFNLYRRNIEYDIPVMEIDFEKVLISLNK